MMDWGSLFLQVADFFRVAFYALLFLLVLSLVCRLVGDLAATIIRSYFQARLDMLLALDDAGQPPDQAPDLHIVE